MITSRHAGFVFRGEEPLTDLAASDLEAIYPKPAPRVIAKARPEIEKIHRDVAILRARHVGY
jgi:hypothetical protein